MEIALFLLLFGGSWAQEVASESWGTTTSLQTSISLDTTSNTLETLNHNSMTSNPMKIYSTRDQISTLPSSSSFIANEEVTSLGTSVSTNTVPTAPEPTAYQEVSSKNVSVLLDTFNATSDPAVLRSMNSLGSHTEPSGTTTSSLGTFYRTSGPPVTMTTSSLETSSVTSGPPVTKTTSSLETSNVTSGHPVTKTTGTLEVSSMKISTMVTSEASTNSTTRFSSHSDQGKNGTLLVAVLVALLVVIVLVALLLLWRRRQKKRTGALTLSGNGKRHRVVDAWAGPARVPDEEAVTATAGGSGGNKGSGGHDGEGSGRQPTLTTFFGRKKSHQGSLALEELEAGSAPSPKGEEEPLVGSEGGTVEAPTCDGVEVRDRNASQCL
ncbi:leukosialin [Orycteropus afer afer]|uniref:Leukosialin n=1 Tax=Orycteropus afer afer TaxID=1230840 RepID=A0A8B7AKG5_ORYAF|nr:leukosialin [Orycteropus afer afer]